MKRKIPIILLFIIGIAIFLYPTVSNLISSLNSSKVINEYDSKVYKMSKAEREKEKKRAKAYNESLNNQVITDFFRRTMLKGQLCQLSKYWRGNGIHSCSQDKCKASNISWL